MGRLESHQNLHRSVGVSVINQYGCMSTGTSVPVGTSIGVCVG